MPGWLEDMLSLCNARYWCHGVADGIPWCEGMICLTKNASTFGGYNQWPWGGTMTTEDFR